jgi:hypothetical protein
VSVGTIVAVKTHLERVFKRIGTPDDDMTNPPDGVKENRFSIAWEYFIADFACSYWKKRRDKAKKAADEVGLLVPAPIGSTIKCYKTKELEIIAKTNSPSTRLDESRLVVELTKKMPLVAAKHLIESCKVENNPATTYSVVSPTAGAAE